MSLVDALVIVALLGVNGFFVGAEFALISARRTQIEPLARGGSRRARAVLGAMDDVPLMLAAAQLGVTLASLALGAVGEPVLAHALEPLFAALGVPHALVHPAAFALALLVVVSAHVIIGEMVPKNLALSGPDEAALWLVPTLRTVARTLRPVLVAINAVSVAVLRALRIPPTGEVRSVFTSDEMPAVIQESRRHLLLDQDEYDRMIATLALRARPVTSVMVPVADAVTVPATTTAADLQEYAGRHGHSRFPVRGNEPGRLSGYLHVLDALNGYAPDEPLPARPLPVVHRETSLADVLATMRKRRAQLAAVGDDGGAVIGVVTLQDVLTGLLRHADPETTPG
ncbi:membrane protein [Sphaerisporangium krabiense]|uniref:CBS domain containing-hemolysin-like protein n=1 Tax=Sphaerisporangium krabiense TaxID=763782 RepID=A0A7W9DPT7_9ACTN|nr:hemolysin family protein [Sphaerisporangium krabiense]MBB5626304.1 CBS domain containing-hemolysin-like protein [Sphaerisporangium krabiense]GII66031.1 membrane protein [Sphaerisporangium krabiense]